MRRCRSWRYHAVPGHTGHRPGGQCRKCWTPCRTRLTKAEWAAGQRRCEGCVNALLFSAEVDVRRALVAEPGQQEDVLRALTTDSNGPVSLAAERELHARGNPIIQPTLRVPADTVHGADRSIW